ncbi:TPA: hypothetical protein I9Y78_001783 [Elizabethkingia anophelis]|uniref:hypothetical protein n=1 Tax=Elizabethkingia anophelis TaxID=1117645 RepID=UPI000416292C|nr:hypothetical protein [Elizabethkingia anophelis]MCT3744052.1 hypothetical protein [Elizabethkingia anophelis]MDC8026600.1 hypothetical protein [Elizabethkingia anophelis]MDV3491805.1 hypothetical protein [Elizabethkingia anophelis]HAT3993083.1 hypothetical protein [Elizabethkingia anophelis]HAT3996444.1 hypothetical protein [Elizabethkingia anophelis]
MKHYYLKPAKGYGIAQNEFFYKKNILQKLGFPAPKEGRILGVTLGKDIYLSKAAFVSKAQLAEVVTHETGHVILLNSNFAELSEILTNFKQTFGDTLDDWGHVSIRKMTIDLFSKNPWLKPNWYIPAQYFFGG